MKLFDVVVLTDKNHAYPEKINEHITTIITEDALVVNALGKENLKVIRRSWDDPDFDWSTTKSVLFRSTWDYFNRFTEFSIWLNAISKCTRLFNSENLIRWNLDKHYLLDLKAKGIHIPDTYFIEQNSSKSLKTIHDELGWEHTVLKPCISGTARHTYKLTPRNIDTHENILQKLITNEAMMLQPFQTSIIERGEVSMMLFNGNFTHAVLKQATTGDFRVQGNFGGSVISYHPTKAEIDFAKKTVNACFEMPIYARVDIFTDNCGAIAIAELELIEPELWFRFNSNAAHVLAKTIKGIIK